MKFKVFKSLSRNKRVVTVLGKESNCNHVQKHLNWRINFKKNVENNSPLWWQNPSAEESRADMVKALRLKGIHKIHIYSNREWHSSCCISLKTQIDLDIDVSYQDNQASSPMDISTASTCLLSRLCVPRGEGINMICSSEPPLPPCTVRGTSSPQCTSHQAVPAHGVQSGEATYNYLLQIADGHFISVDAEPPLSRRGVTFVLLQGGWLPCSDLLMPLPGLDLVRCWARSLILKK